MFFEHIFYNYIYIFIYLNIFNLLFIENFTICYINITMYNITILHVTLIL